VQVLSNSATNPSGGSGGATSSTLPRTGDETFNRAAIGVVLVYGGVILLLVAQRHRLSYVMAR
jgi:hypothetical protein